MNNKTKSSIIIFLAGIAVFVFRVLMGLSKFTSHDELQVYLIGLKSFTTGIFPYFGPDVVYTQTQIPGGLQGLLISWGISLFGIPEGPTILLNLFTFPVLLFFGWYLWKRIPGIPKWFIFLWVLTSPWTLTYSTHIENPSYLIVGSVLFFISIFELGGFYKKKLFHPNLYFFLMGFSLFWVMQLHLSWVLTIPYLLWIYWSNRKNAKLLLKGTGFFILGAAISISTLIPSLLFMLRLGSAGVENNVVFNAKNILEIPNIVLRFMMFASYEVTRFIGHDTPTRIEFLLKHKWVSPIIFFLLIAGFFQVAYFIFSFFKTRDIAEWGKVKRFTLITLLLTGFLFLFSIKDPRSHTFYILYPVATWYSFYCLNDLFRKRIRLTAAALIIAGILFHVSLFIDRYEHRSLFTKRDLVQQAIHKRDYTMLGLRRESKLMSENKEIIWKELEVGGNPVRSTEFDVPIPFFKPQNIVGNTSFKGNYSCKVDSIQPFSVAFNERLKTLKNPEKVNVSFWVKTDRLEDFTLVYEVKTEEHNSWNSHKLEATDSIANNWKLAKFDLELPEKVPENATFNCYFWMHNKSGAVLYVDNLALRFE